MFNSMFLLFKTLMLRDMEYRKNFQHAQSKIPKTMASLYVFTVNIKIKCNFSGRHKGTILMADIRQSHY